MSAQRVPDPEFQSLAASFFNVLPTFTFWNTISDIADGHSISYEYHVCTFPWDGSDEAAPAGKVVFGLFEDKETVCIERFLHLIQTAIEFEIRAAPAQSVRGLGLLHRIRGLVANHKGFSG